MNDNHTQQQPAARSVADWRRRHSDPAPTPPDDSATPYDHADDHDGMGVLATLLDAFQQLSERLRPLTGHINTHPLPADTIALATYALTNGADAVQVAGNLPRGIAHSVQLLASSAAWVTTRPLNDRSSSFLLPANEPVTLQASTDLWVWCDAGTPTVSVAVSSWDAPL